MIFDHLLWIIEPGYNNGITFLILHTFGRIVAPIFCFFIAEGAYYMHNRKKYLLRLFVFAIISHFAYCFAFGINFIPFSTGTFFNQTSIWKTIITLLLCVLGFPSDWSSVAVMIVIYNYVYRNNFKKQMISQTIFSGIYSLVYCFFINIWYGLIQLATIIKIQW